MLVNALTMLAQLDVDRLAGMFWYALVMEIPRFTLGLVVVSGCFLLRRWRPAAAIPRNTRISVLFPGHNEGSALRQAVTALGEQTRRDLQIVVVDDGSTDDMAEIGRQLKAEGLIDVFVSTGLRGGKSAATNLGLTFCTGELVVVGDVDTSFDRYAIERILEPFADPLVGCVSGNIGVRNYHGSIIAKFQAIEYLITISLGRRLSDLLGVLMISSGAFAAFRRDALIAVGGWDVGPGEDANMTLKLRHAGWKVRFAPEAWALTDVPETASALFKQRRRWNASFVRVRLDRFRAILNPFKRNFSLLDALGTVDLILFHAILPTMFFVYIVSCISYYGSFLWVILVGVNAFYVTTTMVVFICAVATAGRYGHISLIPYVLGYSLFRAYVMRMLMVWTYVDEFFLCTSYRDTFVPSRVLKRKP
jgi:cellulose synthase/poly-beta-1,6-N-acetylglucosamine synthase-like glycosyltransferase